MSTTDDHEMDPGVHAETFECDKCCEDFDIEERFDINERLDIDVWFEDAPDLCLACAEARLNASFVCDECEQRFDEHDQSDLYRGDGDSLCEDCACHKLDQDVLELMSQLKAVVECWDEFRRLENLEELIAHARQIDSPKSEVLTLSS
jgi:hypothetical protein